MGKKTKKEKISAASHRKFNPTLIIPSIPTEVKKVEAKKEQTKEKIVISPEDIQNRKYLITDIRKSLLLIAFIFILEGAFFVFKNQLFPLK